MKGKADGFKQYSSLQDAFSSDDRTQDTMTQTRTLFGGFQKTIKAKKQDGRYRMVDHTQTPKRQNAQSFRLARKSSNSRGKQKTPKKCLVDLNRRAVSNGVFAAKHRPLFSCFVMGIGSSAAHSAAPSQHQFETSSSPSPFACSSCSTAGFSSRGSTPPRSVGDVSYRPLQSVDSLGG